MATKKKIAQAAKSKTNLTAATMIVGAVSIAIAKHTGVDVLGVAEEATGLDREVLMGLLTSAAGSLVIYFRGAHKIVDEQDKVTPRPG